MRRKCLVLAGTLGLVAVTAGGCKGNEEEAVKNIKIGITLYDQYDTFISEMMTKFTEYAADKEEETGVAINVELMDASQSQLTQNEQVKSLIEKGCDVICVNLVDRTEPTTITDLAENKQVPIIFFNRELVAEDLERWSELYYVGADALRDSQIPREDWPGVVGIDGTDAGLLAVENGEMLGTVYNDKEGQAREMLNLAFAIATNGDKDSIPLIDGKYVRTPYHKVTQENVEDYKK